VEWFGAEFKVGAVAVGTILAATGTAMPESVVTLVAVLFGSKAQGDNIAVGAVLGGPQQGKHHPRYFVAPQL
jgi:cation:H+ antiporter